MNFRFRISDFTCPPKPDFAVDTSWRRRGFQIIVFCLVCLWVGAEPVFAHKVYILAWREEDTVCTLSYFSDGKKVVNGLIEVYDGRQNKLLEGKTDGKGEFNFTSPGKESLRIVLNASLGHRSSFLLPAEEPPERAVVETGEKPAFGEESSRGIEEQDWERTREMLDRRLEERSKPLTRDLALARARQNAVSPARVAAGIGCIFGIMGTLLFFLARKKRRQ